MTDLFIVQLITVHALMQFHGYTNPNPNPALIVKFNDHVRTTVGCIHAVHSTARF